jgi:predicted Zn-dependent peptidase
MKTTLALGVVLVGLSGVTPDLAPAQALAGVDLSVVEHELANGMRFLVLPRHAAPTVSFVVRYGVGGVNEIPGTTGITHLLEHLLFKGTTTLGTLDIEAERVLFARMDAIQDSIREMEAEGGQSEGVSLFKERIERLEDEASQYVISNEMDRILSRNGARGLNASTDAEATTYYVELPANRLELWFALEADRMSNPVFREFYTERDVVAEERRLRVETQSAGLLYEAHLRAAFAVHPYGQPVVGSMSDIRQLDRSRVQEYYERYYGPNNAVVAIVGDVDPDRTVELAERYFGNLAPGDPPPAVGRTEPVQAVERRVEVVFDAESQVRIGWHVPGEQHADTPALSVLAALLTGGRTARLHRRLVLGDRTATRAGAAMGPGGRFPRLFTIDAITLFPHKTGEIEAAVYEELDSLRHTPPSEAELQRIRNQLEAGQVRGLTSHLGLAFQLAGASSTYGDWRVGFRLRERLAQVRPEDVRRVVGKYFTPGNRTVASLIRGESGSGR